MTASVADVAAPELTILLVEDNDDDALLVREMLIDEGGFVSMHAGSVHDAETMIGARAFQCILLDLSLPDRDGIATVEALRAMASDTPIVVLTGLDDEVRGLEAIRAGAQDYLVKGRVTAHELASGIRFAVARRAAAAAESGGTKSAAPPLAESAFEVRVPKRRILGGALLLFAAAAIAQTAIRSATEMEMVFAVGTAIVGLGLGPAWGLGAAALASALGIVLPASGEAGVAVEVTHALGYALLGTLGGTVADRLRGLRDSRARYLAEVVHQTDAAILSISLPGGLVTSWNPRCESLFGWTAQELVGNNASPLVPSDRADEARDAGAVLIGGGRLSRNTRWARRDGAELMLSVTATPLTADNGTVIGASIIAIDMSAQAAAVRALGRAEERFRGAFANAPSGMAVISVEPPSFGRLLQVNPALSRITGFSEDELLGTDFQHLVAPEHLGPDGADAVPLSRGDIAAYDAETRLMRADGEVIWAQVSISAVNDESGVVVHNIAQIVDITERKAAETARARLAGIVNDSTDAILAKDTGGMIVSWNHAAETLYGYAASEILGRNVSVLVPPANRNDDRELLLTVLAGGSIANRKTQRVTSDGRLLDVSMTVSPIRDEDGTIVGASSIARDITQDKLDAEALRSSEERLRQIVETADEGIWLIDTEGRTTFANPKMAALLGTTPEDMFNRTFTDFLGDDGAEHAADILSRRMAGEADHYDIHYPRPDGSEGCAFVSGSPVRGADGEVTGSLAMVTDVTDRIAAERANKAMESMLHQSQRLESLGQLAGGVAHDMNNLLAVIMNFSDFALGAVNGGAGTEELHEIRHASESAAALVRQLLLFARQEVTRPEILDLNPLLEGLDGLLRGALAEQIDLTTTYGSDLPVIRADAGMIEQIVMNLVVNARDAMPAGGAITLSTSRVVLGPGEAPDVVPGEYVRISVTDTGVGMTSDVAARAFDPFFSTKPRGSGTGLGLSTVYGIAARFGGYVELDSHPGDGTSVRVCFPASDPDQQHAAALGEPTQSRPAVGGTILVVEDDDGVRRVTSRILEERGFNVLAASRPSEAMGIASGHGRPLDLLLTDVVMPEMSGPALAARLRERQPGLPVVFASGYTSQPEELPEGAHFIAKPFNRSELLAIVAVAWDEGQDNDA